VFGLTRRKGGGGRELTRGRVGLNKYGVPEDENSGAEVNPREGGAEGSPVSSNRVRAPSGPPASTRWA